MHMISKKVLNDAEMDTLTKSCSPTIVLTANGEVQTHEEATVCVKELDIFWTMKVLENTPAVLSLGKLCDENGYSYEWINGQNHISIQTVFGCSATRRTSFRSWFQACQRVRPPVLIIQLQGHLQDRRGIVLHLLQARLLHQRQQHQVTVRLEKERIELKVIPLQYLCQISMLMIERGNPLSVDSGRASSKIPEWLQEFREILVGDEVPLQGGSHASSSHEVSLETTFKRREDLGKHSVYTHFPQDRNCEICQRTKITRAPCRRRDGGVVPRAVNFGDLITADHKVLSENCESRNNHRYAIVVQDLIWILGSKLIRSNNQSRATLWVLETCFIVGLLPFIIILITASLSSNTYNKAS